MNRKWPYYVAVTDARGHPLGGRVDIEFVFSGRVVGRDTPPTHSLRRGRWHDLLTYPPAALGIPLSLQVVVHTRLGTVALDWPVKVRR